MVRIIHIRKRDEAGNVLARGGMTLAVSEDGAQVGVAICSDRDNYSKRREDDGQVWARARLWLLTGGEPSEMLPDNAIYAGVNAAHHGLDFDVAVRKHIARRTWIAPNNSLAAPRNYGGWQQTLAVFGAWSRVWDEILRAAAPPLPVAAIGTFAP